MLDAYKARTSHMFSVGVSTIPNVAVTCKLGSAIKKKTNLESIIHMCETACPIYPPGP